MTKKEKAKSKAHSQMTLGFITKDSIPSSKPEHNPKPVKENFAGLKAGFLLRKT